MNKKDMPAGMNPWMDKIIENRKKIQYPIGGYAPGEYMSICNKCNGGFIGDKRSVECEACAINRLSGAYKRSLKKQKDLERELENIKDAIRTISAILK